MYKIIIADSDKFKDQIVAFQMAMALETENLQLDQEILSSGVGEVLKNPIRGRYLLTIDNESIVGMLLFLPEWSDWRSKEVLWIHSVFVKKEYRKQSIYKNMYLYLKQMVIDSKDYAGLRLYVDKTNGKAKVVYSKLGMSNEHYELYEWLKS